MDNEIKQLNLRAGEYGDKMNSVLGEMRKVIVGQDDILRKLLVSLVSDGHVLLEGVPGLAKTLMIKTLSEKHLI
jgi:MoxR-like ATPase